MPTHFFNSVTGKVAITSVATVAAGAGLAGTAHAETHFNPGGVSSVDGDWIRYESYTQYSGSVAHAINAWYKDGGIKFGYDDIFSITDLEIGDANRSDVSWLGRWSHNIAADKIDLNVYFLGPSVSDKSNSVLTHELGHALGINDHTQTTGILMYQTIASPPIQAPTQHDWDDYNTLWF
ncbi:MULTISPECIES: matrixin family metalloprotease [Pseudofrankia]|uniref:matrixin family metalloprotease n=1 Tax=Pseudofrankia TaxID=2994363 RepID=UPI0002D3351B|nr:MULTISPECIES: matrixin family metalloprotease [Pseudofrankia]